MNFYPFNDIETISPRPMLFIAGENAHSLEFSEDAYKRAEEPKELTMSELNGNEKYFHFSNNLPTHPSNPMTIYSGDLMLWGTQSFVLFYETFSTSYAYTRIGRIEDVTNLAHAVGRSNVVVKIELE